MKKSRGVAWAVRCGIVGGGWRGRQPRRMVGRETAAAATTQCLEFDSQTIIFFADDGEALRKEGTARGMFRFQCGVREAKLFGPGSGRGCIRRQVEFPVGIQRDYRNCCGIGASPGARRGRSRRLGHSEGQGGRR